MLRMLRDILSVTATRSCDSTPVPATKPRSSAFISVTGTPEGFRTPEEAHPLTRIAARINKLILDMFSVSILSTSITQKAARRINVQINYLRWSWHWAGFEISEWSVAADRQAL